MHQSGRVESPSGPLAKNRGRPAHSGHDQTPGGGVNAWRTLRLSSTSSRAGPALGVVSRRGGECLLILLGRHPGWREGGADGVQLGNQRMEVLRTSTPSVVGLPKRPLVAFTPAILKLLVRPFFRLTWAWRGSISTPRTVGVRADEFAALFIPNPRPRHLPQNCAG